MCEEKESCHDRTEGPVVRGQSQSSPSFVPSVIKTNIPFNDDPAHQEFLLQRYRERIEKLSQQDRLSKFWSDAGFLTTVEVGLYFMTKDTEEFSQFTDSVASREYSLPRDENLSELKGWIRGNTQIGTVLEVITCCLQGKYGVEIRIESVNKDHSHSWVRISHGLNKLVTNLNNNEQETSEMQFEDCALKLNASDFACRWKAKAKPQRRESASSSTRTVPVGARIWTDVEPGKYSLSDYPVSKKLIHLLRHGRLHRDNDGATEFWRIKRLSSGSFCVVCHHWSDEKWKSSMAGGEGNKKRFQYCADSSGTILYFRALQGHSGRNLIESSLQDNVVIPDDFFKYNYHVGCAINLHSMINSRLTPGGQNLSNRQTVFFLPVDPMDKEHKDPEKIDLNAPRHAQYMHKAWKKHQNMVYWVAINLAQKKGLRFYQTRSNAIILQYPEGCSDGNWRSHIRESVCVTSGSSEDFLDTLVPISWMCKKQTSVLHSSTESEIISLDAGFRLDGISPFLIYGIWSLQFLEHESEPHWTGRLVKEQTWSLFATSHDLQTQAHLEECSTFLNNVDRVHSNVQSSHQEALLYVFEDNEAGIKMIIKGRSPTMRQEPEPTELLLIGCLIESIWTPKIQIKYIDTKNQLADILTKENFTRDEWNHLLCLFNISHVSSAECSEVMSKRTK